jgi:CRISPR-associated protein Csm1
MSVQVFLQGKILGFDAFLGAPASGMENGRKVQPDLLLAGRSRWISLLSEILPRALLCELGLSKILLGSSGGGQFLVVLPVEARAQAEEFMRGAAHSIYTMSGGNLQLVTAATENLGDWSIVRRRLAEIMNRRRGTPASGCGAEVFEPFETAVNAGVESYFTDDMAVGLQTAQSVGWSPDEPSRLLIDAGKHTWPVAGGPSPDAIFLARHAATSDDGAGRAVTADFAARAQGRKTWGVLRGDVDGLGMRLRQVQTIEEHIQLSVMFKQFFAGELELVCSLPEYWRKVTILYSGGDDFAVLGSWDALIPLAREVQRLFHRFCEENLKEFPGPEGKTITMALALARDPEARPASVFEEAGRLLNLAKSTDKDCMYVLGHTLEWRQLAAAAELRETMLRIASELASPRRFLAGLEAFYRKAATIGRSGRTGARRLEKPWQVQRRLARALGETGDKELQKLRTHLTNEILARGANQVKVRPGGRVALEWARLQAEV